VFTPILCAGELLYCFCLGWEEGFYLGCRVQVSEEEWSRSRQWCWALSGHECNGVHSQDIQIHADGRAVDEGMTSLKISVC